MLRCTQFNKYFKAVVYGSPKLQRALFFRREPTGTQPAMENHGRNTFLSRQSLSFTAQLTTER